MNVKRIISFVMVVVMCLGCLSYIPPTTYYAETTYASNLSERELYYNFPSYLNNGVSNTREAYANRVINWALDDISKTEEVISSLILALKNGLEFVTVELLSLFNITQSEYDNYVNGATISLVEKYLELNSASKDSISNISTLYGTYIKKAYDIYSETEKATLISDLKNANSALSDDDINRIVKGLTDDSVLPELMKYAGEGIEISYLIATIVQLQEIELTTIDNLISVAGNTGADNELFIGLVRLREDITSDIGSYVIKTWTKDTVISKIASTIQKAGVSAFGGSSAASLAVDLAVTVVAWIYENNHPDAKEIIEALIFDSYVNILGASVNNYWYDIMLASKEGTMNDVLMKKYKVAHDFYYINYQCTLEAVEKCTDDDTTKKLCKDYANAFRNTWTYDEYINQCLQVAQTDIDAGILVLPEDSSSVATGGQQGGVLEYDSTASIQAKFNEVKANFPVGTTWTGNWGGAWQCFGFARMVFSKVFGCEMPSSYCNPEKYQYRNSNNVELVGQLTGSDVTVSNIKNLMSKGKLGDIIQANGGTYGQHTMVFESYTDTGVLVYDCNATINGCEPCTINEWTITWNQLASWYGSGTGNGISLYHAANYENIYGDGTGLFYDDSVNFVIEDGVLVEYTGCQSFVEIPDTVTVIGERAFYNNKTMVSVTIPNTVTSIGDEAFYNCTALAGVSMPDSVEEMGYSCFQHCENLEYAELSDNLKKIEKNAFYDCQSLKSIHLPNNIETIGSFAFSDCTSLYSLYVPNSLTTCEGDLYDSKGPFSGCSNLNSITFEEGIAQIPDFLFADCTGLKELIIPDNVTSIGDYAFEYCANLSYVEIPDTVTTIGQRAFYEDVKLTNISLPSCIEKLGGECFGFCESLTKINIPKSLVEGGGYSYQGCSALGAFNGCANLKEIEFEKGITKIPTLLFDHCSGIESIVIPNTVTEIESSAFAYAKNLNNIEFSANLVNIDGYAFQYCTSLTKLVLPSRLTTIGVRSFYNCTTLKEVKLPEKIQSLNGESFGYCQSLDTILIPKSLIQGGSYSYYTMKDVGAFSGCTSLKNVELEYGIESIPSFLFDNCIAIEEINVPETVTTIGSYAFRNCESLELINIPGAVTVINGGAFYNAKSLQNIFIPNSVNTINKNVFYNCSSLKTVLWETEFTSIPQYAFYGCSSLSEIVGFEKIQEIGDYAFYNCDALTSLTDMNNLKTIGSHAFYDCDELTTVDLSDSVKNIYTKAFANCDELVNVYLGLGITKISSQLFMDCPKLQNITIPYNVTEIGSEAFKNDTSLVSVTIPQKTTTINSSAFSYPGNMTIFGVSGSYAETFADEQGIQFVNKSIPATSISLPYNSYEMDKYDEIILTPIITPTNFTDLIVYESSNTDVVTVSEDGLVYANGGGTAIIKITAGNVTTSCEITVIQPVTSVRLNTRSIVAEAGETYQLIAYISPDDATDKSVTWSSSNTAIATVDGNGKVTAIAPGTAAITATANDGSGRRMICNIQVQESELTVTKVDSITLNKTSITVDVRTVTNLTATINPSNASNKSVTWSSSNTAVATVDRNGKVTAVAPGTATITVIANDGSGKMASCTVTVQKEESTEVKVSSITLNTTELILDVGTTSSLTATINPSNATNRSITWTSSDINIATIDENGILTVKSAGKVTITAKANDGSGITATCVVTVLAKQNGWIYENDTWYYYIDGIKQTGWINDGGTWYYMNSSGAMRTGWIKDGGIWYYMNSSGVMQTGWIKDGGTWYYMNSSGAMQKGWVKDSGTWYYLKPSGAMATGWVKDGGTWYYLKPNGAMATGWIKDGGTWYYLKSSGAMATGWVNDDGTWYYLKSSGEMATGWIKDSGTWYYLYSSGAMAYDTWIGSYYLNASGAWVK